MAAQERLDLLKRSVREWNQWRETNSYTRPNLSDADLRGARLSEVDLNEANLSGAILSNTILAGIDVGHDHTAGEGEHADLLLFLEGIILLVQPIAFGELRSGEE